MDFLFASEKYGNSFHKKRMDLCYEILFASEKYEFML